MEPLIIEVEVEGKQQSSTIKTESRTLTAVLDAVRAHAGLGPDATVYEREKDSPLGADVESRNAISVVVHRCKQVLVSVQFEQRTEPNKFPPSATIFRVLQWAISKKVFNLDDTARAKANLILPGADQPLPRDAVIGQFVQGDKCSLTLELTLKDFTNG